MNINITLVIQALNFFCAYLILRRYLFRPLVVMVRQEKIQQKALNKAIRMREQKIDARQEQLKESWTAFQIMYAQKLPAIEQEIVFKQLKPPLEYKKPTAELVATMVGQVVPLVVQKAKDVR